MRHNRASFASGSGKGLAGSTTLTLPVIYLHNTKSYKKLTGFNDYDFYSYLLMVMHRFIMEYATDMTSARKLWESTNNTVGFNHMISSGKDATDYINNGGHSIVALIMETMYGYTAYFHDNDPR